MKKVTSLSVFVALTFIGLAVLTGNEKPAVQHGNESEVHWGYEGAGGPEHWGDLKDAYETCGEGMAQSPIDLKQGVGAELKAIQTDYKSTPLKIVNNGHTIQVNYETPSSYVIDGKTYKLLQFHFHTPSEHTVEGEFHEMELHLVHQNDQGQLAVLGVFMEQGKKNSVIEKIWDHMPTEINSEKTVSGVTVNAANLLPEEKSYYHYYGSLTTPPCSEGVNWTVLKSPISVSKKQVKAFADLIGDNNRPVQPLNSRFILETD
jgi:carbonic anhydrase